MVIFSNDRQLFLFLDFQVKYWKRTLRSYMEFLKFLSPSEYSGLGANIHSLPILFCEILNLIRIQMGLSYLFQIPFPKPLSLPSHARYELASSVIYTDPQPPNPPKVLEKVT